MYNFINNWTSDNEFKKDFDIAITLFIDQFKSIKDSKSFIIKILNIFQFIDYRKYSICFDSYLSKLKQIINNDVIVTTVLSDNFNHNSDVFFGHMKGYIQVRKNIFLENDFNQLINSSSKIVIVDDYSGSLTSFIKFLKKLKRHFNNCNISRRIEIIFCPFFINESAENKFESIQKYYDCFDIKLITNIIIKKIFSLENMTTNDLQCFNEINAILGVNPEYIYGYKTVEDLTGFFYFIPNTTLGFLWCHNNNTFSLFDRNRGFRSSFGKLNKNQMKYFKCIVYNASRWFLGFICILLFLDYSKDDIQSILGIDDKIYENKIKTLLQKKAVIKENSKFIAGDNINMYVDYNCLKVYLNLGIQTKPEDRLVYNLINAK